MQATMLRHKTYAPNSKLPFATLTAAVLLTAALVPQPAHAEIRISLPSFFNFGPKSTVEMNSPGRHLRMQIRGSATFNATEDDVQTLNGKMTLQEKRNGQMRRMVFESDAGGITRTYTIDGKAQPLDADGRRWLATLLPWVIRETAFDMEKRIKRIHAAGGADAVLAEIERIETGHARGRYIDGLSKLGALEDRQVQRLIAAVAAMDSDFERRSALSAVTGSQTLSTAAQVAALNVVAKMDSSFEQRSALVALTPKLAAETTVAQAWLNAAGKIDSDFELRGAIDAIAKREPLSSIYLDVLIEATLKLDSDFEHAAALVTIGRQLAKATPAQMNAYLKSVQKIDSDFERKNVLVNFINRNTLDKAGILGVLQAMDGMSSGHEIRSVLSELAQRMPADSELVARYRRAARNLNEHERGRAEKALDHLNM
ncbi:MAG: hypothetical protein JNN20_14580 [Betaproteobacteria bacterium]|nr:hypothetical protein [Betaproteobacteria bacterium]